jgi:hypothetical protein
MLISMPTGTSSSFGVFQAMTFSSVRPDIAGNRVVQGFPLHDEAMGRRSGAATYPAHKHCLYAPPSGQCGGDKRRHRGDAFDQSGLPCPFQR